MEKKPFVFDSADVKSEPQSGASTNAENKAACQAGSGETVNQPDDCKPSGSGSNRSNSAFSALMSGAPQGNSRRERFAYSPHQRSVLSAEFNHSPYPNYSRRLELATQLGICEDRVHTWFTNKRSRTKKKLSTSPPTADSSSSSTNKRSAPHFSPAEDDASLQPRSPKRSRGPLDWLPPPPGPPIVGAMGAGAANGAAANPTVGINLFFNSHNQHRFMSPPPFPHGGFLPTPLYPTGTPPPPPGAAAAGGMPLPTSDFNNNSTNLALMPWLPVQQYHTAILNQLHHLQSPGHLPTGRRSPHPIGFNSAPGNVNTPAPREDQNTTGRNGNEQSFSPPIDYSTGNGRKSPHPNDCMNGSNNRTSSQSPKPNVPSTPKAHDAHNIPNALNLPCTTHVGFDNGRRSPHPIGFPKGPIKQENKEKDDTEENYTADGGEDGEDDDDEEDDDDDSEELVVDVASCDAASEKSPGEGSPADKGRRSDSGLPDSDHSDTHHDQ